MVLEYIEQVWCWAASFRTGWPVETPPRAGALRADASGFHQQAFEAAGATKEEHMEPLTVAASVVLVLVLVIFVVISIFGLMGQDSRRW